MKDELINIVGTIEHPNDDDMVIEYINQIPPYEITEILDKLISRREEIEQCVDYLTYDHPEYEREIMDELNALDSLIPKLQYRQITDPYCKLTKEQSMGIKEIKDYDLLYGTRVFAFLEEGKKRGLFDNQYRPIATKNEIACFVDKIYSLQGNGENTNWSSFNKIFQTKDLKNSLERKGKEREHRILDWMKSF